MSNFEDLVKLLEQAGGISRCTADTLAETIAAVLTDKEATRRRTDAAYAALHVHSGATRRSVELVETRY